MSEVGTFVRGRRFTKADFVETGIPAMHYSDIYMGRGASTRQPITHVAAALSSRLRFASPGDVVIAAVGETVEDLAKSVAWLGEGPIAIHDDIVAFRSELNPRYVAYWMQTTDFHGQKVKHVARAKVKRISSSGLGQITIPVPPMAEQDRVVAVLEEFEALVNDLTVGLPAELTARRKQYEHYRDGLLTFEEVSA